MIVTLELAMKIDFVDLCLEIMLRTKEEAKS